MANCNTTIAVEIAKLMERHGGEEVAAVMKAMKAKKTKANKKDEIVKTMGKYLDNVLAEPKLAKVSLKDFKAEAVKAWNRAHPEGMAKRSNAYTEYVKVNMQSVKDQHPKKTHEEHMKIMGQMWKKNKVIAAAAIRLDVDVESSTTSSGDSSSKEEQPADEHVSPSQHMISEGVSDLVNEMLGGQPDELHDILTTPKPMTKANARKADDDIAPTPKKSRRSVTPTPTVPGCRVTRSSSKQ